MTSWSIQMSGPGPTAELCCMGEGRLCVCVGVCGNDLRGPSNCVGSTLRCSQTNSPSLFPPEQPNSSFLDWGYFELICKLGRDGEGQRGRGTEGQGRCLISCHVCNCVESGSEAAVVVSTSRGVLFQ